MHIRNNIIMLLLFFPKMGLVNIDNIFLSDICQRNMSFT